MDTKNKDNGKEEVALLPRALTVRLLFFIVGLPFVLLFGIAGFLITGHSARSDVVFAVYALPSGVIADIIVRRYFKIVTLFTDKPRIPFVYVWIAICILMIIGLLDLDEASQVLSPN